MHTNVYWIRQTNHTDMFSQGYIGVSKHIKSRFVAHAKKTKNAHLKNAIEKYGWNNLVKETILIADDGYCYDIEKKLRPNENIGWNINSGGVKPPRVKNRGEDYISPLKGKPRPTPWLKGLKKPMSKSFFVNGGKAGKGRKQTPEQIAKRVASRKATLEAQGRTH